ncbi:MAG TPA: Gfo/Idh/MocA family oxidoreductase [Rhodanobacteraceae bacterium]|nr:Gfo/Idh/MocA family oxidoreductase [Rhodanobacteraceae bacterium]
MDAGDRDLRWGIIGCGNVTEVKSGPAFRKAAHSTLVAVMRRDAAKARDYAQRHGVPRWYDDAAALVADAEVDAVYVATPPSTHKHYALMGIAAGKPVYVEKPMAMDSSECGEIVRAARTAGVPVFVAYYRRALPRFAKVRELLFDERAIGNPRAVHAVYAKPHHPRYDDPQGSHWHVRPEISGGGLFVDVGCHTLDILDWLFGPIVRVDGQASNQRGSYAAEDSVAMSFAFGNGMPGTGLWIFDSLQRQDSIEVIGDAGRLSLAIFGDGPIRLENAAGVRELHVGNPPHIQQPLIETIVRELRGEAGACPSSAESAARTTWAIDEVLRDYRRMAGRV